MATFFQQHCVICLYSYSFLHAFPANSSTPMMELKQYFGLYFPYHLGVLCILSHFSSSQWYGICIFFIKHRDLDIKKDYTDHLFSLVI